MNENTIFSAGENPSPTSIQQPIQPPQPPPQAESLPSLPPSSTSILPKIVRIFIGLIVFVLIIFLIFGFVLPKFSNKTNITSLVYWGLWEDQAVMKSVISDFERLHPEIKIDYSKQDIKQYRERLQVRSNNGNGPDIFRFHNTWVSILFDLLLPLPSSTISKEDFSRNYYPVAQSDFIKNGAIYGIPLSIDTLNLFINKEIFEASGLEAPTTWIDFGNYARQLIVKDESGNIKTAGAAMGTSNNITHFPDIVSMLFLQNGVNLHDISTTSSEASDALNFYTSFVLSGNVWDESQDSSIKAFAGGNLAMYFGYSRDYFTIKSLNPNLSFDIVAPPQLPGQNITVASYWAEGVSIKSRHQKEALLFLKYLSEKETQQKLFNEEAKTRSFGEPYSRIDLAQSLKDSVFFPFVQSAPNAVSSFFVDGTYDDGLSAKANAYLGSAIDSILKGTSPQIAAESLSQGISQTLQQYGQ